MPPKSPSSWVEAQGRLQRSQRKWVTTDISWTAINHLVILSSRWEIWLHVAPITRTRQEHYVNLIEVVHHPGGRASPSARAPQPPPGQLVSSNHSRFLNLQDQAQESLGDLKFRTSRTISKSQKYKKRSSGTLSVLSVSKNKTKWYSNSLWATSWNFSNSKPNLWTKTWVI